MRIFILSVILLLITATFSLSNDNPLRIAVDCPYPPFVYIDEKTGNLAGFDVDIANTICRKLNRQCDIKMIPFDEIIPSVVSGKIDMGVAGMAKTTSRETAVLFSNKYFRSHSLFIEVPGSVDFEGSGLKGKIIAVQSKSVEEIYVRKHYENIAEILVLESFDEIIAALFQKKADVAFVGSLSVYYFLATERGQGLEIVGDYVHMNDDGGRIIVAKTQPDLLSAINQALTDIRETGEYDKINRKYFLFNIY